MMSANYNMRNAVSRLTCPNKKSTFEALSRGCRSKNKWQSWPASPNGSSTNLLATHLERRIEAAQSNRTSDKVTHSR